MVQFLWEIWPRWRVDEVWLSYIRSRPSSQHLYNSDLTFLSFLSFSRQAPEWPLIMHRIFLSPHFQFIIRRHPTALRYSLSHDKVFVYNYRVVRNLGRWKTTTESTTHWIYLYICICVCLRNYFEFPYIWLNNLPSFNAKD